MKLHIKENSLYADNIFFCYCDAGNGRDGFPTGHYEVAAQYSHAHGRELAHAYDLGWIGDERSCDIVLGRVRGRNGVIPSRNALIRLLSLLESCEYFGCESGLVIA